MKKVEDWGKTVFCWAIDYKDFYIIYFLLACTFTPSSHFWPEDDKKMEVNC